LAALVGRPEQAAATQVRREVWTDRAISDLAAIDGYISDFNPLAAERLAAQLIAAAQSLGHHPHRGRAISPKRRELTIATPYLIRYRVTAESVVVLTIRHGARRSI